MLMVEYCVLKVCCFILLLLLLLLLCVCVCVCVGGGGGGCIFMNSYCLHCDYAYGRILYT